MLSNLLDLLDDDTRICICLDGKCFIQGDYPTLDYLDLIPSFLKDLSVYSVNITNNTLWIHVYSC